jgi:hypothetical protein
MNCHSFFALQKLCCPPGGDQCPDAFQEKEPPLSFYCRKDSEDKGADEVHRQVGEGGWFKPTHLRKHEGAKDKKSADYLKNLTHDDSFAGVVFA